MNWWKNIKHITKNVNCGDSEKILFDFSPFLTSVSANSKTNHLDFKQIYYTLFSFIHQIYQKD